MSGCGSTAYLDLTSAGGTCRRHDDLNDGPDGEPESNGSLSSPVAAAAVATALSVAGWIATNATDGWLRIVVGVATVAALGYALYVAAVLVLWFVLDRAVDSVVRPRREGILTRLPWFVWMAIPLLIGGWALWAWLAGYDAAQWLWTGVALALVLLVVVAPHFRHRRSTVPDGPDGPRHRRRTSD